MPSFDELVNVVEWEKLRPHQWSILIPDLLRVLYHGSDNILDDVFSLRRCIAYNSGLYETTLATVPILLYLLDDEQLEDKSWVLEILNVIWFKEPLNLPLYRQVYDKMHQGFNTLVKYANHKNSKYRGFAINILRQFVLHADTVLEFFVAKLDFESDTDIILVLLNGIRTIHSHCKNTSLINDARTKCEKLGSLSIPVVCFSASTTLIALDRDLTKDVLKLFQQCEKKFDNQTTTDDYATVQYINLITDLQIVLDPFHRSNRIAIMKQLHSLKLPEVMHKMLEKDIKNLENFES